MYLILDRSYTQWRFVFVTRCMLHIILDAQDEVPLHHHTALVYDRFGRLALVDPYVTASSLASILTLIWRSRVASYFRLDRYSKPAVGMEYTCCLRAS